MTEQQKTYRPALDVIVEHFGDVLPEGCDRWGIKSTRRDLTTRNGFQWPFPGGVAQCSDEQLNFENSSPCPDWLGDGLCVANTYCGMASGGFDAQTMLLVAYALDDVLAEDADKVRVRRVHVVRLVDGLALIAGANLSGADLYGADLSGADLSRADLSRADLSRAIEYSA